MDQKIERQDAFECSEQVQNKFQNIIESSFISESLQQPEKNSVIDPIQIVEQRLPIIKDEKEEFLQGDNTSQDNGLQDSDETTPKSYQLVQKFITESCYAKAFNFDSSILVTGFRQNIKKKQIQIQNRFVLTESSFLFYQSHQKIYPLKGLKKTVAINFNQNNLIQFGDGPDLFISNNFNLATSKLGTAYLWNNFQQNTEQIHLLGAASAQVEYCEVYEIKRIAI